MKTNDATARARRWVTAHVKKVGLGERGGERFPDYVRAVATLIRTVQRVERRQAVKIARAHAREWRRKADLHTGLRVSSPLRPVYAAHSVVCEAIAHAIARRRRG